MGSTHARTSPAKSVMLIKALRAVRGTAQLGIHSVTTPDVADPTVS
jgi:hypothetical protein